MKKAIRTSQAISGPSTGPAFTAKTNQFVPNWQDMTMPDTTPMANMTAKILSQYLDRSR